MSDESILSKPYNPQESERKIYELWQKSGAFLPKSTKHEARNPKESSNSNLENSKIVSDFDIGASNLPRQKDSFVVVMPPPNVTGTLHIGHALGTTLQDIMARYHRLKGDETLYLPGTDHAGIATQAVVERKLAKEGKRRHDIGREQFIAETQKWKDEYHERIVSQIKAVGASCDWSREAFTLNPEYSKAVDTAFKHLYDKGLIYRGTYIVNWCPKCGTAIADDEVEHKTLQASLYFFKYDKDFPITIATTRPETKLGDTAVAVNPSDERYKQYVGQSYDVNFAGVKRAIKIIADPSIDKDFGTGAVGVTPAHSFADWLLKEKHGLDIAQVIDEHGRMTKEAGGDYAGLKTLEARAKLVEYLKSNDLLEKDTKIEHNLSVCYRCGGAIEPLPSLQWFVKMKPLAQKAMEAVKSGQIKIAPKRFEKIYFHWLENIRDWCISRQLWWGHRIPVWYKRDAKCEVESGKWKAKNSTCHLPPATCHDIYIGKTPPDDGDWIQDPDVLDTWFSSALWPFATLGWPESGNIKNQDTNTKLSESDYYKYYPTSVLETGYDIIFFWVSRMIMMGLELTGKAPFDTVYLHGMVRDEHGRKMSKSLGNIVEPVELANQWGTDAIRMALVIGTTAGGDVNFAQSRAKGYRNFANKIWNASRFVISQMDADLNADGRGSSVIARNEITKQSDTTVSSRAESRDLFPESIRKGFLDKLEMTSKNLSAQDRKDLEELDKIIAEATKLIEHYQFSRAGETLYEYFWHTFADVIIERSKGRLKAGGSDGVAAQFVLWQILRASLIMLHPFMPYVTETIWQEIPIALRQDKMLITASWPESSRK